MHVTIASVTLFVYNHSIFKYDAESFSNLLTFLCSLLFRFGINKSIIFFNIFQVTFIKLHSQTHKIEKTG